MLRKIVREELVEELAKTLYKKYLEHYANVRSSRWDEARDHDKNLLRIQAEAVLAKLDELGFDLKV